MTDLSRLPQVDAVVRDPDAQVVVETYGRRPFTDAVRRVLEQARERAHRGSPVPRTDEIVSAAASDLATRRAGRITRVINATGVVLHTNLGRAPLSTEARAAMAEAAGYCTLEYELTEGRRGSRTAHLGYLAAEACGAEAATVVNSCAAAVVLVLAALAGGKEAIVSRGELVEIGGSFRLPDVMAASTAVLREVGTTNRTRIEDYRAAIGEHTGVVMKVHRSNYQVVGFAAEPTIEEIATVARDSAIPFVYDLGSGLLRDLQDGIVLDGSALADEPSVERTLAGGADLVLFSGDKLLGGPQAGFIAGRESLVLRCDRHPLARALRVDKFRRAALEVTLESHLRADVPLDVPVWAMLTAQPEQLHERAARLADKIGPEARAVEVVSLTGGGSLPGAELPSGGIVVTTGRPDNLAQTLRLGDPPIVGRLEAGALVLDLRTVPPSQDDAVANAVRGALGHYSNDAWSEQDRRGGSGRTSGGRD
ncbi:MAG: L-seryl-tRNA(Sec) selenium transferase [Actinomycetota bacterium]|nr:L-seryl-tRNA(Sec) selenium transferase [Actinomycetota bacterium]